MVALAENMRAGNTARVGAMRVGGTRVGAAFGDVKAGLSSTGADAAHNVRMIDFTGSEAIHKNTVLNSSATKVGIVSLWFFSDAATGDPQYFFFSTSAARFALSLSATGAITLVSFNSSGQAVVALTTTVLYENDSTLHHLLLSWDSANAFLKLYVDGVDVTAGDTIQADRTIDWPGLGTISIGANLAASSATSFEGQLGQLYLNTAETLDITTAANRLKFRSASGGPVDLGPAGKTPTGNQPSLFLNDGFNLVLNNRGSSGSMTSTSGTMAKSAHQPAAVIGTDGNQYSWAMSEGVRKLDTGLTDLTWTELER